MVTDLISRLNKLGHLKPDEIVEGLKPKEFVKSAWGLSPFPDGLDPQALVLIRCVETPETTAHWVEEYGPALDGHFYWCSDGEGYTGNRSDAAWWQAETAWFRCGEGDTLLLI